MSHSHAARSTRICAALLEGRPGADEGSRLPDIEAEIEEYSEHVRDAKAGNKQVQSAGVLLPPANGASSVLQIMGHIGNGSSAKAV